MVNSADVLWALFFFFFAFKKRPHLFIDLYQNQSESTMVKNSPIVIVQVCSCVQASDVNKMGFNVLIIIAHVFFFYVMVHLPFKIEYSRFGHFGRKRQRTS